MFTRLWWNTFSTGNYRLRPLDLSARSPRDFHLLSWGEKQVRIPMDPKWWVSTSMEHDFVNHDSKFNFFPLSNKKKDILIELRRNRPQLKNYVEIVYSFIVSIQFIYHLMPFVTLFSLSLSLSLSKLRGSSIVGLLT